MNKTLLFLTACMLQIVNTSNASTPSDFGSITTNTDKLPKLGLTTDAIYITMPDGVRLAADAVFPKGTAKSYPTVLFATRYWRSFELRFFPEPTNQAPINYRAELPDFFIQRGYAVVFLDVRGTGASEGMWSRPWAAEEREDLGHVVDWIAKQPWSNGKVATMGLSYEGTTALFTSVTKPTALKAVVARQFEFDVYTDLVFPGGIFNDWFMSEWSEGNRALDKNRTPKFFPWYARLFIKGPRAVNHNFGEVKEIINKREPHDVYSSLKDIVYRDDLYGHTGFTQDEFSPFTHKSSIEESNVPLFIWGSWMDGSTADSVIRTFINLKNPQVGVIGAWDHMAEHQGSPYGDVGGKPVPGIISQWEEMKAFIDAQVSDDTPPITGKKIIYYTMGEEQWKQTPVWPPEGVSERIMYFSPDKTLTEMEPEQSGAFDSYKVDFKASTGTNNRWHTEFDKKVDYGNRAKADKRLLTYTSLPLSQDMEITGNPVVNLQIQSTETDGAFYVYLEDVHPDGTVTMITDGQMRALHRKVSQSEPEYKAFGPYHSYRREDAMPLVPNETATLHFALRATSVLLRQGHRIRVSIAGHDKDTFVRIPEQGDPLIKVMRNKLTPSHIVLPVMTKSL